MVGSGAFVDSSGDPFQFGRVCVCLCVCACNPGTVLDFVNKKKNKKKTNKKEQHKFILTSIQQSTLMIGSPAVAVYSYTRIIVDKHICEPFHCYTI